MNPIVMHARALGAVKKTNLEEILATRLQEANLLSLFGRQVRFKAGFNRKWRFDFYSRAHRLAVEVEGGTFAGGRHSRGPGMTGDMEKYNEATLHDIRVLRFDSTMILPAPLYKKGPKSKKIARRRALEGCAVAVIRRALYTEFEEPTRPAYVKKPRLR